MQARLKATSSIWGGTRSLDVFPRFSFTRDKSSTRAWGLRKKGIRAYVCVSVFAFED